MDVTLDHEDKIIATVGYLDHGVPHSSVAKVINMDSRSISYMNDSKGNETAGMDVTLVVSNVPPALLGLRSEGDNALSSLLQVKFNARVVDSKAIDQSAGTSRVDCRITGKIRVMA